MSAPPPFPTGPIQPEKPKLTWYQYVWIGWPLVLVAVGGAIGGGCGGAAMAINYKVFQKTSHPVLRYVWTGLISLAAVLAYVIVVVILFAVIHRVRQQP
jgi:H+/Cl- antiporter ClcA